MNAFTDYYAFVYSKSNAEFRISTDFLLTELSVINYPQHTRVLITSIKYNLWVSLADLYFLISK